jgi:nitrous oxidase accessory protein NosD
MPKVLPWFAVLPLMTASMANAARLIVAQPSAPCPGAQYSTIGAAIQAAMPGDRIDICPALYAEQLVIDKPLTLRGIDVNGANRVVIQPAVMVPAADSAVGQLFEAVVTVMNTHDVTIENLAIDASKNGVNGCSPLVGGVHFYSASGKITDSAVFGAQVSGCSAANVLQGSGTDVQIDADPSQAGDFVVSIDRSAIEGFSRNGILALGAGVTAQIRNNAISGPGPASGVFQFGVFLLNGAVGRISDNVIHEGPCGSLTFSGCLAVRSEGITLRAVGDGTVVERNVITSAQSGIFINGGKNARIVNNLITNIDLLSGIDIQGTASGFFSNSRIANNTILNVASFENQSCGISEAPGTGVSGNVIANNTVNDAYCGVGYVGADHVSGGTYQNTFHDLINADQP